MTARSYSLAARTIAAFLAATVVVHVGGPDTAYGAPTGTVSSPAPSLSRGAPKAADIADGDASVSGRTGDMTYSYPIAVPPGRNGMAPKLSLEYSSNSSIYGGIAAGWSLSVPQIVEDTSQGRLPQMDTPVPGVEKVTYLSTMAGRQRLIPVYEPNDPTSVAQTYRAQHDDSFMRYERMHTTTPDVGSLWRVRAPSGTVMLFGENTQQRMSGACLALRSYSFAPVTTVMDVFGNVTAYHWGDGAHAGECVLQRITWGQNVAIGAAPFAQLAFNWQPSPVCGDVPVGSHTSYRTGQKMLSGASQLATIVATAFDPSAVPATPQHTRRITLGYDAGRSQCNNFTHSPVRLLTSIQESAWGVGMPQVNLPAVTFEYGNPSVDLSVAGAGNFRPLSWGKRYPESSDDRRPTVESMLLDVDGDGLLDEMFNESRPSTDGQCNAVWYKGRGGAARTIPLPRLKWNGSGLPGSDPAGSPLAADDASGFREGCALNGQATVFRNSEGPSGLCRKPAPSGSACSTGPYSSTLFCTYDNEGTECPQNTPVAQTSGPRRDYVTYLLYRWFDADGDGLVDLVAAVDGNIKWYDIVQGNLPGFPAEPDLFGAWPECPTDIRRPPGDWPLGSRNPYQRCYGLYPWFIYRGLGNGLFAGLNERGGPVIKYSPIPLDPDTGDSTIRGPNLSDTYRALMDFDGDGILDAIQVSRLKGVWHVWLGDGTGGFRAPRYTFPARVGAQAAVAGSVMDLDDVFRADYGLFDIHSDGLPEHWIRMDPSVHRYANLAINSSLRFDLPNGTGALNTPTDVRPGSDRFDWITQLAPFQIGVAKATNRTVDVDHDGRVDVVTLSHSGSGAEQTGALVFYNVGGQFQPFGAFYLGDERGIAYQNEGKDDLTWQLNTDVVDLDGDGIMESVAATQISRANLSSGPPRLMTAIDNGRGAKSFVTYASMHDTTAVEQHPEQWWPDWRPKASPRTQWVVKNIRVRDNFPTQDSTTSFHYKNPRYGADDRNIYAFRGFEEVTITRQSGAQTIETYGYDVDYSGRLVKTVVKAADGQVHSIAKTTWEPRTLFGRVTTIHAVESEALVCANGQTESTCTADTAPGYTRNLTTMTALGSTTSPANPPSALMWAATRTTVQSSFAPSSGDRRTTSTYHLYADAEHYQLRPNETTREAFDATAWNVVGKMRQTWDSTYRYKQTDEVWFNAIDADRAITSYVYQPDGSGNLMFRIKPKQIASGARTTYTYDSRKLFVASEVNELGHQLDYTYEYGTGKTVQTDGPDVRTCTTTCPPAAPIYPVKERTQLKLDGLGRPLEQWETFGRNGDVFTLQLVSTTSYVDGATSTTPTSVTTRVRLDDTDAPVWAQETTQLDGHGRPIKKIAFANGAAPADSVTTYSYAADGTLRSVSVPDPTTNDTSLVTYSYTYDSLGRPRTIRRPDNATATSQSGVNMDYDGVTDTTTSVVGAAGGQPSITKVFRDRSSRVVRIDELRTSPSTWATTTYVYGADGSIASIVGPQGVTTSLKHDFTGNRTEVTRHGRTWKYRYDKNGNLESELAPGSTATTQALYTTSIAYDDLDRPTSKAIAPRSMSAADQALFGVGTETFAYDGGSNGIGELSSWRAGTSSAPPVVQTAYSYDAQGNPWGLTQTAQVAGYPALSRQTYTFANIFGAPSSVYYLDKIGASTSQTVVDYIYDARGMPASLRLHRTGETSIVLAEQTRNVGGYVTKRRNNTAAAYVEANFTYDKLGRTTRQDVLRSQTPTRVVRQDLSYFGNDNPRVLTHYLGATSKAFNFGYDPRGQLTSVASTTAGYFNATYRYGAGGRFTRATETQTISPLPTGTDVRPRDVNYVYGDADPERVTALTNVVDSTTHAGYRYDASGNLTRRCYGGSAATTCAGESMDYAFDGKDQLRRATRKLNGVVQGSEEYWYGPDGDRVAIVKRDAAGAKQALVIFIGGVEAHYDASGATTKIYSHVSLGTPVARVERTAAGTSLEYQFHGLGDSTIAAVAYDGTVNASFSYAPFGELLETTSSGTASGVAAHKRRFNDKYQDDISGLGYYGARYYDKTLMGWTQADPVYLRMPDAAGNPRRANIYQFVLNNPLSYVDPDGLRDQKLSPPSHEVGLGYTPAANDFGGFGKPDWATNAYWLPWSIYHWSKQDPLNRSVECSQPGPCGDPVGQYVNEWLSTITEKQVNTSELKTVKVPTPETKGWTDWTICNPGAADCEVDFVGAFDLYMTVREGPNAVFWKIFLEPREAGRDSASDNKRWAATSGNPDPWATDALPSIADDQAGAQSAGLPPPGKGPGTMPLAKRDKQRAFKKSDKSQALTSQKYKCAGCGKFLSLAKAIGHHIKRWADGGKTNVKNCACLCGPCHKQIHKRGVSLDVLRRRHGLPPIRVPARRLHDDRYLHSRDEAAVPRASVTR